MTEELSQLSDGQSPPGSGTVNPSEDASLISAPNHSLTKLVIDLVCHVLICLLSMISLGMSATWITSNPNTKRLKLPVLVLLVVINCLASASSGGNVNNDRRAYSIKEASFADTMDETKGNQFSSDGSFYKYRNVGSKFSYDSEESQLEKEDVVAHDTMDAHEFIVEESQHIKTVRRNLRHWTGPMSEDGVDGFAYKHNKLTARLNDGSQSVRSGDSGMGLRYGKSGWLKRDESNEELERSPVGLENTDTFTLGNGMKRLNKLQHNAMRGSNDADPVEVLNEVKDILKSHLDNIIPIQEHLNGGNREGAGLALKSMIGDTHLLVETWKKLQDQEQFDISASFDGNSFSLDTVHNDQVAQFIPSEAFDELVKQTRDVHELLNSIDPSILHTAHSHERLKKGGTEQEESTNFDNTFDFAGDQLVFSQELPNENLHATNFFKDPSSSMKKFLRHHQDSPGSLHKLGKYTKFHHDDVIMAKHMLRVDALGDTCARSCDLEDSACWCGRLFDCVKNMTEYDLTILVAGGFIDTNPSSNTYGNFSIPSNLLNLYNADQGVAVKLSGLKTKAAGDSNDHHLCNAVLGELFSACDPDKSTCTNPNVQSFAVSTDQICGAVNSGKKLLFESIGDEFDGFADKFSKPLCQPLSYDVCAEFAVQFDKLYEGRDKDRYNLGNPMLKMPSNAVHNQGGNNEVVFDRVQFPVRYNFVHNEQTGMVAREFHLADVTSPERYFFLTNPTSGKVLGLHEKSCDDNTPIDLQDREKNGNSNHQQFSLSNDGRLISKACDKVLSNKWLVDGVASCRNGNALVILPSSDTNVELQRWTFGEKNSIINSQCGRWNGDLAISVIKDDTVIKIDYPDMIHVQFINPESNMAMGLESGGTCTNGRKVKSQAAIGGDDQTFYLKRIADGLGDWEIRSKACPNYLLEISGITCEAGAEIQLHDGTLLGTRMDGLCRDAQGQYYKYVHSYGNKWYTTCMQFCQSLVGFERQVGMNVENTCPRCSSEICLCLYEAISLPSSADLDREKARITDIWGLTSSGQAGSGPVASAGVPPPAAVNYESIDFSCYPFNNDKRNHWKIYDSKIESAKCKGMVMEIQSTSTPRGSKIVLAPNNERGWNQAWTSKSNSARLLTANGDPSQYWKAVFARPSYDYALLPGFPGPNIAIPVVGQGRHFSFQTDAWEALFGKLHGHPWTFVDIKQCRSGEGIWSGQVKALSEYGESVSNVASDHWQQDDIVTKPDESCPEDLQCFSSTRNKHIAKSAMHSCDASMSLLLGSTTSIGTLRAIASLVNDSEKGPHYMPGTCCMDSTMNSDFFGYRYDPKLEDSAGNKMSCEHSGPWHLGISEEACENAGGKWYRTPCITLQSCIDSRPPRFGLRTPSDVSCQDSLSKLNTAFVSGFTGINFPFDSNKTGCFKFCQSLQGYPLQIGMEVQGTESSVTKCVCLYNSGKVPRKALLPEYATRSPPKFSVRDATGTLALGLPRGSSCTANVISVEFQASDESSRQEFQITYDGRIVSAACPNRVLAPTATVGGSRLVALAPHFNVVNESLLNLQRWNFTGGSIDNVASPNLKISFMKTSGNLRSFYFALENPKSQLTIGAVGTSCRSGSKLVLQKPAFGSSRQQFYIEDDKIINVLCPDLAISTTNTCNTNTELVLSNKDGASTWQWQDCSLYCFEPATDCSGVSFGYPPECGTDTAVGERCRGGSSQFCTTNTNLSRCCYSFLWMTHCRSIWTRVACLGLTQEPPTIESKECRGRFISIDTEIQPIRIGAAIILSDNTPKHSKLWEQKHERFQYVEGPFSFVNPTSDTAIGVKDGKCVHNNLLETQMDACSDISQQFYIGRHGSIISALCIGLVISADMDDTCSNSNIGQRLKLQSYMIDEKKMKWNLNNDGSIESVKCKGVVIGSASASTFLTNQNTDDSSQIWRRQNVRLMDSSNVSNKNWKQNLVVRFTEQQYNVSLLQEYGGGNVGGAAKCHLPNDAFNRAFEDFVSNTNMTITNAADEDQCEHAREELGFEPDHPFDTEVCQRYAMYMCDPYFTGIDHVTEPPLFEHIKYEEVEYEGVEYEAPDYATDKELPFQSIEPTKPPTIEKLPLVNQEYLVGMQKLWLDLQNAQMVLQHSLDASDFSFNICDLIPETLCLFGCITNAAPYICRLVVTIVQGIFYLVSIAVDIYYETVNRNFEIATLGPNQAIYGFEYSQATYTDLLSHIDWSKKSLNKINQNMHNQHELMTQHLHNRHFAMESNIGQDIFDAQNTLGEAIMAARNANGRAITSARNIMSSQHLMMHKLLVSMCEVYEAMNGVCTAFIGPLEEYQSHIPLELHWPEAQLTLMDKLQRIEETLANGAAKTSEDEGADQVNTSTLEVGTEAGVIESLKVQMVDAVGRKMDAKLDAVERKMDAKMEAVEGNVKEMKEMLMKLMEAMGQGIE